jgi:hypothetical protein
MSLVTDSSAFKTLKATLEGVVTDSTDGIESKLVCTKYMKSGTMTDAYEDELENGGPGLASEVAEGTAITVGSLYDGASTRYIPRKFGIIMQMTEEIDEDGKYNGTYLNFAKRNKRAVYKTLEIDCANVINRAATAGYTGGDGVTLASASHTIPGGGTYSNTLSTPFSPSRAALIVVRNNLKKLPGHDGITEGYDIVKLLHPVEQFGVWAGILGSDKVPESGNNEINVVKDMGIQRVEIKYMTSTTNWGVTTDAPEGLKLRWKKKPKGRTWYDENTEVINHGTSARWARGWTDPRGFYFSNA